MEDKYTSFISEYNKLETILCKLPNASQEANMRWLEDSLTDMKTKSKLHQCRVLRNYIQHNPDYRDFINISPNMIVFLQDMYKDVLNKLNTVEIIMIPNKKIQMKLQTDNINDAINIMINKNIDYIPIINNDVVIGILSKDEVLKLYFNNEIKKTTKIKDIDIKKISINKNEIKFIEKNKLLEDALNLFNNQRTSKTPLRMLIVTSNGKSTGTILGLLTEFDIYNLK